MAALTYRPALIRWLYNHNPFYAISAALLLIAVQNAYGTLEIGAINCWIMMGVLAGYTALLAGIGVLIVRWGKVWEDARSLLAVLLFLFLAVSVSADDLFVKMESPVGGALLLLCGYIFSAVVSEGVLRGARIRVGLPYRIPYHLLLALFYVAPWWCSPELHPRSNSDLEWTLFLFPVVAAVLLLCLMPAVRRGPGYVAENGTPWRWPWFPWTAFGIIVAAVAVRTFALCMTFGPTGPIWVELSGGARAIAFDTMWGPYFLIPPALAVLLLLLEAGLVNGNVRLTGRVLRAAPLLVVLALPISQGAVFQGFLRQFTTTLGSPVWLAVCLLLAFYVWASIRRVSGAGIGALATMLALAVVGRQTVGFATLTSPQAWPIAAAGAMLIVVSVRERSSKASAIACVALAYALWLVLPATMLAPYRMATCYHLLWGAVIALGLMFHDEFSTKLRMAGAALVPVTALIVLTSSEAASIPMLWKVLYVVLLAAGCVTIAQIWKSRWYLYAFTSLLAIGLYGASVSGFRGAVGVLGRAAITSFAWCFAALIVAILISAHKARWLPSRLSPLWLNGNGANSSPEPLPPADGQQGKS